MLDRFWNKVEKTDGCWNWTGTKRAGYGQFWLDGRHRQAHRVSYEWENGPIPDGLVCDHICRNKACVRPSHLRAVTQRDNLLNGPTVILTALAKTECNRGHSLSGDNLRIDIHGYRVCRECERIRWRLKEQRRQRERALVRGGDHDAE